ncbi:DMT family transporter [Sinomonas albida]|uniref:DMT family transporter n=1 Tax=Sinomonas albida TaxID=369942 RepID=UPI0010A7BE24|nr:DMT family transporter [Sinomonas albida]
MTTRRLGLTATFIALALVWGSSFLLIKESLLGFTPGQVAVGRIVFGAITLRTIMVVADRAWPREPRFWGHMAVVGLLFCVVPFSLFAWAGESLPSGLSAILNSSTPLMTALWTAAIVPAERLTPRQAIGVAVGGLGVVLVVGPWGHAGALPPGQAAFGYDFFSPASPTLAELACLGATACYGLGFAYMRRFVVARYDYDSLTVSTVQVTLAAAVALALSPILAAGPLPAPTLVPVALVALAVLGVFGTGVAYLWNTAIVRAWGAVAASTVTYVAPLVGVALGTLVLGETLTWNQPLGCLVVIAGIIAIHRGSRTAARPSAAPAPAGTASRAAGTAPERPLRVRV